MAAVGMKRSLPPKVAKMKARKKQRLDGQGPKQSSAGSLVTAPPGEKVRLESLAWKPVSTPENMDDYEGFFGLEEIDGVDVVKAEHGGAISFVVSAKTGILKDHTSAKVKGSSKGSRKTATVTQPTGEESASDAEPWDGFEEEEEGDDDVEENPASSDDRKSTDDPNSKEHRERKTPSATEQTPFEQTPLEPTGFAVLDDATEESETDVSAWRSLGLSGELLGALSGMHFASPTPIQAASIPVIQDGRDVIGKAPTGSGKTLAFGIPIVEDWLAQTQQSPKTRSRRGPLALIIEPTRELAQQITDHVTALCSQGDLEKLRLCTLIGGLSIQKQRRQLSQADIVVATPGRLWEVIGEGHGVLESLRGIGYLVVDEADRLLSEGHFKELEQILDALDREVQDAQAGPDETEDGDGSAGPSRQTLVFSATFSKSLQQKLSKRQHSLSASLSSQESMAYLLRKLNFRHEEKPFFIDVNPSSQMAANLREGMLECPGPDKDLSLYALLLHHPPGTRALVFVNSISAVRRIVPFLTNLNMTAHLLHSQMPQKARLRSVERFSALSSPAEPRPRQQTVLVATDLAARGLDIPQIDLVLHYHVPRSADTYIHRSGRTARAGHAGTSILLCAPEEAAGVRRLVARVHASAQSQRGAEADEESAEDEPDEEGTADQAHEEEEKKKKKRKGKSERRRMTKRQRTRAGEGDLHSLSLPPRLLAALRPRAALAKRLADAGQAKEKTSHEDRWVLAAAEELGISLSDEEFAGLGRHTQKGNLANGDGGKGRRRKERERAASGISKAEAGAMRAELRELLSRRVNVGVSERYLTAGNIDVGELLRSRDGGGDGGPSTGAKFLGTLEGLGF